MESILFILFGVGIILFILSFFLPNRTKEIKNELEQLSLQLFQETYQIKRRLKILEEELLIPNNSVHKKNPYISPNQIIINQVQLLYQQGLPIEKIARQSALSVEEVIAILESNNPRGK
ncbi:hypothetical protein OEV98_09950 [Caldibacillus lycopersici]|uniref:Resolvase HTH domain-containing protein n=1 Tax=Perspicuibacillus lycopersici TaxID=1325689 RepID=A0AAE3IT26_9BACI|nr:hypothetical protein [Perspicuibacillus lycopersici]MCU9613882.1 hypothetical protein [Perspicuibacillus lycopersici]